MICALTAKVNNKESERRLLEGMNMFMALIVVTMMRTYLHLIKLYALTVFYVSSVQFSRSVVSYSLRPHEPQYARPPCPSPTPGVHSNSRPLSRWCHPAISSSVIPLSSCPQSLPASESFPMSQCQSYLIKWFKKKGISVVGIAQALCSRQNWFWISVLTLADMNKMIFKIPPLCRILVGRYGLSSWC